jgi:hypothetical protein
MALEKGEQSGFVTEFDRERFIQGLHQKQSKDGLSKSV